MARALLRMAHSRMLRGELRGKDLEAWNQIVDDFIHEAKSHLGMS